MLILKPKILLFAYTIMSLYSYLNQNVRRTKMWHPMVIDGSYGSFPCGFLTPMTLDSLPAPPLHLLPYIFSELCWGKWLSIMAFVGREVSMTTYSLVNLCSIQYLNSDVSKEPNNKLIFIFFFIIQKNQILFG